MNKFFPVVASALWLLLASSPVAAATEAEDRQLLTLSQQAVGNKVGVYTLTDTMGRTHKLSQWLGKPLVVSMIYTSCYQICSMTTRNLADNVQKARDALGQDSFHVITVGFDSRRDSPQAMNYFAKQQGVAQRPGWTILSGEEATITALSRDLGFRYYPSPKGFNHMVQATILDRDGVVYRQVYGEVFDPPALVEPLKELVLGRPKPNEPMLEELTRRVRLFCTTYDPLSNAYRFDYSLFVGMTIGGSILFLASFWVWRERRRSRREP